MSSNVPVTSRVVYEGQLRTRATHLKSGEEIITDAPTDNHGKGAAFSPTDLCATALASCLMTIMGIAAEKRGLDLRGMQAEVVKEMTAAPRRIGAVRILISMPGKFTAEDRAFLERTAAACPVGRSLSTELIQDIKFSWSDAE